MNRLGFGSGSFSVYLNKEREEKMDGWMREQGMNGQTRFRVGIILRPLEINFVLIQFFKVFLAFLRSAGTQTLRANE